MAKKETKYYDIKGILETESLYNFIIGSRSNGKSYAVKKMILWEAYNGCDYLTYLQTKEYVKKERYMMGYIRRFSDDIKNVNVTDYFTDMGEVIKEVTHGEYTIVDCYQGSIYFANVDDDDKIVRGKQIGRTFSVAGATHYKSRSFPYIGNLVYEEFLPEDMKFLPREVGNVVSIMSTILRNDLGRLFMIANNTRGFATCPFFREWQLTHINRQKPGTIEVYEHNTGTINEETGLPNKLRIAVEFVGEDVGQVSEMYIGKDAHIITSSKWETDELPHLENPLNTYKVKYKVMYKYKDYSFLIFLLKDTETKKPFLYVFPHRDDRGVKRFVTQEFSTDPLVTEYLTEVTKYDKIVLELIKENRICFSDNLSGTQFISIKVERGKY